MKIIITLVVVVVVVVVVVGVEVLVVVEVYAYPQLSSKSFIFVKYSLQAYFWCDDFNFL